MCAQFQAAPKESYHKAVKHILRYLAHTPTLGLWYPMGSTFDLIGYSDSDYAGDRVDRKSINIWYLSFPRTIFGLLVLEETELRILVYC